MHPALLIIVVVCGATLINAIGHARITALLTPLWLRLLHASDARLLREGKRELLKERLTLAQTSAQDDFAKWAKCRRRCDKLTADVEAANARLQSATSTLGLLVRGAVMVTTTAGPFLLTSYHSKTPMFFLPPARPGAPEGTTWLGPIGWVLSLAAAPSGSVSAGVWSTIVTRVLTLLVNGAKSSLSPLLSSSSSETKAQGVPTPGAPVAKVSEISEKSAPTRQEGARRRTAATAGAGAGEKEL